MDRLIFSRGSPNSLYVAVDTYANIVANYTGASWSGCTAFASDLKAPLWHNGSRWCLDSAYTSLYASPIGFIYFGCSGATATQSGNTVTVSQTAHGLTSDYNGYSINLYQLSGSFAGTNGWYTEFNYINANTFSCVSTVSNTVSVPESLTSNTAETFAPDLFIVPQGLMQNGMSLSSLLNWRCKSNGNTKTNKFYFCGLVIGTTTGTTFTSITGANANSILFLYPDQDKFFVPGVSTAAETLTNRKFTNSVQLANGGDWAVFIPRSIYAFEGRL